MAANMIPNKATHTSAPKLSEIELSLVNVRGAVAAALAKVIQDDCDSAGALTLAVAEMDRIQEKLELLQRLSKAAQSDCTETSTDDETSIPDAACRRPGEAGFSRLSQRIEQQRDAIFGPMAMIAVARDSVSIEVDCNMNRLLDDAYKGLDKAALELWQISADVRRLDRGQPARPEASPTSADDADQGGGQ